MMKIWIKERERKKYREQWTIERGLKMEGTDSGSRNGQRDDKKEYVNRREGGQDRVGIGNGQEGGMDMRKCCVQSK